MKKLFSIVVLIGLAAVGAPAQGDKTIFQGEPDFSGFQLVAQFIKLPADRNDLMAVCRAKSVAIEEALKAAETALETLQEQAEPTKVARLHVSAGEVSLYRGDIDRAVAHFETAYRIANQHSAALPELAQVALYAEEALGVAHMRRGEVENCANNHNAEMCIFPLSTAAQHKLTSGSERAIEYFEKYLSHDPANLEVRWLLNVAYQTLGRYPNKVPKDYLIPPSAFESKDNIGRFADVAPALGLDLVGSAGGTITDDFDNDGFLDIVITSVDPCQSTVMYHNNGDGTYTDVSVRSKLAEQVGGINCTQTDFDNDGWLDIFVMRGGWEFPMRNSLLRNNRDGTFTDVTPKSGLGLGDHRTQSASWADYDNDGWLDVYVGHENTPSQLFRNRGDGTFEDVSRAAHVDLIAFTKAVVWGDYDDDGFPDIYVSNYTDDNFLYHNNGDGTFDEVAVDLRVEKPNRSFPCWFWDYDNDAKLDLFVSSYTFGRGEWVRTYLGLPPAMESMKLYRNTGKGTFTDVTKEVGLDRGVAAMGSNYGDLDGDGFLDFYLGTGTPSYAALMPNVMYRNRDGKYFVDVTTSTGTGHLQKGHGVAFADLDNDGDQDVYENMGGAVLGDKYNKVLYENPGHGNNWISIKLVGAKSNRAAIGARIKLTLADGAIRFREVSSGGSFGSSPLAQQIGLGKATRIASIEVTWPTSKTRQVFTDVAPNQFIQIKELEKTYTKRPIKPAPFKKQMPAGHHH
jgi:hypothetical protein